MTDFMDKRRRPWMSWIPAVVLSILIVAGIGFAVVVTAQGLGEPAPAPTEGQVTDTNWSIFTETGLAYIDRSREVRFDFSDAPVEAAPLGLEESGSLTIGPHVSGTDYLLTFFGDGEAPGGDRLTVSEFTIETSDGAISAVRAPLSDVLYFRATVNSLLPNVEVYGWEPPNLDELYDMVGDAADAEEDFEFSFGPGDRLGSEVTANVSCAHQGGCLVEYVLVPSVR